MTRVILFFGLCLVICAYALWRGRNAERWMALLFLGGMLATILSLTPFVSRFIHVESGAALVDTAMLVAMIAIVVAYPKPLLIGIAALQLVTVLMHLAKLADPETFRMTYAIAMAFWSYPQLALLAAQTYQNSRESAVTH